jgi:hypothetical protein
VRAKLTQARVCGLCVCVCVCFLHCSGGRVAPLCPRYVARTLGLERKWYVLPWPLAILADHSTHASRAASEHEHNTNSSFMITGGTRGYITQGYQLSPCTHTHTHTNILHLLRSFSPTRLSGCVFPRPCPCALHPYVVRARVHHTVVVRPFVSVTACPTIAYLCAKPRLTLTPVSSVSDASLPGVRAR